MQKVNNKYFIFILLLILPIFFSLGDGLYVGQNFQRKKILELPIPISFFNLIVVSVIIIFNNIKKYYIFFNEKIVQTYLISLFLILFINIFYLNIEYQKIFILAQFFLPLLGLFAGYFFFEKIFFLAVYRILFIFFSIHLFFSFLQGKIFLVPNLFFFEIYQNFQYVNTTLVFLACISLMIIREQICRINFFLFICLTFFYSFFCYSFNSVIIFLVGLFLLLKINFKNNRVKYLFFFLLFFSLFFFTYQKIETLLEPKNFISEKNINYIDNYQKFKKILNFNMPESIRLRFHIFNTYIRDIAENNTFFFGSRSLDLDEEYNGAHNLFIDSVYKFGFLLFIPFFYLFISIFLLIIKEVNPKKKKILIFFLLFILLENFFKVSLKQPYSGIISYYIFAILLFHKKKL